MNYLASLSLDRESKRIAIDMMKVDMRKGDEKELENFLVKPLSQS